MTTRRFPHRALMSRVPVLAAAILFIALGSLFFASKAEADFTFPGDFPKTSDALTAVVNAIPGLEKTGITNFKAGDNAATADVKIKNQTMTVAAFKPSGGAKVILAVLPTTFKLSDFLPIPSGTPIDGVSFKDMALVFVPKGGAKTKVSVSGLPAAVRTALKHGGTKASFKEGLNLFGQADFAASGGVKKVLQAVGLRSFSLPLKGGLPSDLLKHDPKSVSGKLKDQLLDALRLDLRLGKLKIPHMPKAVSVKNAVFTVVSKKFSGKRKIFAGVNGKLDATVAGKKTDFAFYVLAEKAGSSAKVTLKGDTKSTISLPFFHSLDLTGMNLAAVKSGNKWDITIDAKAKLKSKEVDVTVHHDPKAGDSAVIKTKMKLADLLPGGTSVPGLTDLEFDELAINKNFVEVQGKVRKLDVLIAAFKRGGKTHIAVSNPRPIRMSNLISAAEGTPLDDASFEHMSYIWVPQGADEKGVEVSDLPSDIAYNVKQTVKQHIDLAAGLNVFGRMAFKKGSNLGRIVSAVGIKDDYLPLVGKLSPKIFRKGQSTQIKNEILDNLDIRIPIKVSGLHLPKAISIKDSGLEIKGVKTGNKRAIDVAVRGELDAKLPSETLKLDYEVVVEKSTGQDAKVSIKGQSKKGTKLTLPLVHRFTLTDLSFDMSKVKGKWQWTLDGKSTFKNKPVDTKFVHWPNGDSALEIKTKMTIADLVGQKNLPGLDDVELDYVVARPKLWFVSGKVKGETAYLQVQKPKTGSGHLVAAFLNELSLAELVPGGKKAFQGIEFTNMVALYNPGGRATKLADSGLTEDAAGWVKKSNSNPSIKPGLNVFGHMDIKPSSKLASLLKQVGVSKTYLPLNGALSPKVFSKNASSIKNEILEHLDVKVPLPTLKLPGVPKVVNINHARIAVKGKIDKGKRSLSVDVAGRLDVAHGSSKADFDFDIKLVRKSGRNKVQIDATEVKGTKLTIKMLESFTLSNMSFHMDNFGKKGWNSVLKADSRIRNNKIHLSYYPGDKVIDIETAGLNLAKLTGASVPGLDSMAFDGIRIDPKHWSMTGGFKGQEIRLSVQKGLSGKGHIVAADMSKLAPDSLIPGSDKTPLKDVTFDWLTVLYTPEKDAKTLDEYYKAGLAYDPVYWVRQSNKNPTIKQGMNVFGHMDIKPSGEMAKLLKAVGVTDVKIPLNGKIDKSMFHGNPSAAVKNAILDNLDINLSLPPLKIPEVDKFLTFANGKLHIKGKTSKGKTGIDVALSGDADLKVKSDTVAFKMAVEYDRAGGSSEFKFSGKTKKKWTHPLGIRWLDLDSLTVSIDRKKKKSGGSTFDIDLTAKTDVGSHSRLDVTVDVHEKDGKVTDAFFELDGPLKLSEIPGVKEVPEAGSFEIKTIKVSEHGIEAKTDFGKNKDLDIYLFTGSGWNLILRQDHFAITEFVPPLSSTPLKHIKLSEAAMVLSTDGLDGPLSGFSTVAQDALKDIYGKKAANIKVDKGLSLIAAFEHKNSGGKLPDALKRLGLSEERVVLTGDIGGLFGGPTKLDVEVDLSAHTGAKNQPKFMKSKPGVEAVFSLIATETSGQFDIEIGIGVDIIANVHGTELDFDAKAALEFEDEKIDVKVVADLKDKKGWKKPFGIPGFTLYEVGFDLGLDEDGGVHLGFTGDARIASTHYKMAADADLEPEALGAPKDIAFKASADKVDILFVEEIAVAMIGGGFNLDIPHGIFPEFKNVSFAFATPGAQDPDLHITGEGLALKGQMTWLDHELGEMDLSISPTKGIYADGGIDPINLGPLELKKNHFTMDIGIKDPIPTIKMKSNIKIEYLGLHEDFDIKVSKKGFTFDATADFGQDFKIHTDFKLSGIDLSLKKPDFKKADFYMEGDLTLDIGKFIAGPATDALNDVFNGLNAAFKEAEKALTHAKAKVDRLTGEIDAERAKVRRERAAAERKLHAAEDRVNRLNGRIDDDWGHYHHCHGWGKWACKAKWGIRIGALKAARGIADAALRLAETITAHFPIDLDPRVAILIAARDTADVALTVVKDAVEGADFLDKFLKKATDAITKEIGKSINIKKAGFAGDFKDMITKNAPLDLTLDVEFFGATINQTIPFKLKDIPYDVKQMAMMGLHALSRIVDDVLHWLPGSLKHKIHSHISSQMDAKAAQAKRELAKYGKSFEKYAEQQKVLHEQQELRNEAFLKVQMAERKSPLDHRTTGTFSNDYIEVGHTGLCLTVNGGYVQPDACNNKSSTRFSTAPAKGAPNVAKMSGYVFVKTSDGKCVVPEGQWNGIQKTLKDPKLADAGSITYTVDEFQGDGKIAVKACRNKEEYYWKVLQHGDQWMQIANRATSRCLHFEHSSAMPKTASAEWKSCVGSANQVYRVADSASPKYYKAYMALKNDAQGVCLSEPDSEGNITSVFCDKAARYDYVIDVRGYIKYINTKTGHCLQPESYKNDARLIEKPCSQLDYQWWDPIWTSGGWKMQNAQTKTCTYIGFHTTKARGLKCDGMAQYIVTPVTDPNSGMTNDLVPVNLPAHYNPAYPGTPKIGICSMNDLYGNDSLPGTMSNNNTCWVADRDWTYKRGKDRIGHDRTSAYFVKSLDGAEWVSIGKGTIPNYAITNGFYSTHQGNVPAYTCRAKLNDRSGRPITRVGWTIDAAPKPAECHYVYYGTHAVRDFEVLTRQPSRAYKLDLGALKPGGSAADLRKREVINAGPAGKHGVIVVPPWEKIDGHSLGLGAGDNGSIWSIGPRQNLWGYVKGGGWKSMKACAKRLDVGPGGDVWWVTCNNELYHWAAPGHLVKSTMGATDVGVGADGTVWFVSTSPSGGGYYVYRLGTNGAEKMPGAGALRLDVDAEGNAWIVQKNTEIWRWSNKDWVRVPGKAVDIAIGGDGTVVMLDLDGKPHQWTGSKWEPKGESDGFDSLTVDSNGNPWAVLHSDKSLQAWGQAAGDKSAVFTPIAAKAPWRDVKGYTLDIGAGANGSVWRVGFEKDLWTFKQGGGWEKVEGCDQRIDVAPTGNAWGVNCKGTITNWKLQGESRTYDMKATDIGVGANGTVWFVGAEKLGAGYTVYRIEDGKAQKIETGGAVRIDVDNKGNAWIVQNNQSIWRWNGKTWAELPGKSIEVGIGADGTVVSLDPYGTPDKWTGSDWKDLAGTGNRYASLTVDAKGNPWAVVEEDSSLQAWGEALYADSAHYSPMPAVAPWTNVKGQALDIAAGANGSVWKIGPKKNLWSYYKGGGWGEFGTCAKRLDVGSDGTAWWVTCDNKLYRWEAPGRLVKSDMAATDVGVGADGTVWFTGTEKLGAGYTVYRIKDGILEQIDTGGAVRIDVDNKGNAWIVQNNQSIWRWNGKSWTELPSKSIEVGIGADGTVVSLDPYGTPDKWTGSDWRKMGSTSGFESLTVDRNGEPWAILRSDYSVQAWSKAKDAPSARTEELASAEATSWHTVKGQARDIGAGANGSVWKVGPNHNLWSYYHGGGWGELGACAKRVDLGPDGTAWWVTCDDKLYRWEAPGRLIKSNMSATDVGIGADGTVWFVGTGKTPDGYTVYRISRDGIEERIDTNGAVRIDVDREGNSWVVQKDGKIWRWNGRGWSELPGKATDIGIGADGRVYILDPDGTPHKWTGRNWEAMDVSGAESITADRNGEPWVTYKTSLATQAFGKATETPSARTRHSGTAGWIPSKGKARDIGAGPGGPVWRVGTRKLPDGYSVERLVGGKWESVYTGGAERIDVDKDGRAWIVQSNNTIWRNGPNWQLVPGRATDIGVGAEGSVWFVGAEKDKPDGNTVYRLVDGKPKAMPGSGGVRLDVDRNGNAWVVQKDGQIWRWTGNGWAEVPGRATDIGIGADGTVIRLDLNGDPWKLIGRTWRRMLGNGYESITVDGRGNPWASARKSNDTFAWRQAR